MSWSLISVFYGGLRTAPVRKALDALNRLNFPACNAEDKERKERESPEDEALSIQCRMALKIAQFGTN